MRSYVSAVGALLLAIQILFSPGAHGDDKGIYRVYFIGNSVTDMVRYDALAQLAQSRQVTLKWGRDMIPGAPLEWIFTHPNDGFAQDPFGHWPQALGQYPWDAISLQPFDRQLKNVSATGEDMGDVALIAHFAEMAAKQNPDVQVYIYSRWPRLTHDGKAIAFNKDDYDPTRPGSLRSLWGVDDYTKLWNRPYTGGWDLSNESSDYFDKLLASVRAATPFLHKPPLLIPVGQVMEALHQKMVEGQVPGYHTIYQFYRDGIHLNEAGTYAVGCTFLATLLQQSPVGLPTQPYGTIDPAIAKIIQETAWEVVSSTPEAGVKAVAVSGN